MRLILPVIGLVLGIAATLGLGVYGWGVVGSADISWQGWLALVLGVIATAALGGGLMALVFYSNRRGFDDDANENAKGAAPLEPPPEATARRG